MAPIEVRGWTAVAVGAEVTTVAAAGAGGAATWVAVTGAGGVGARTLVVTGTVDGICGAGGAPSTTTGALASAVACLLAALEPELPLCFEVGIPYELETTGSRRIAWCVRTRCVTRTMRRVDPVWVMTRVEVAWAGAPTAAALAPIAGA